MWPLCSDTPGDAEHTGELETEAVDGWEGGAERVYFNTFRIDWKRVHNNSLRSIPVVDGDEDDDARRKAATRRMEESANAMTVGVAVAMEKLLVSDGAATQVPLVWDTIDISTTFSEYGSEMALVDAPVESKEPAARDQIHTIDGALLVDRLDREDLQSVFCRLQAEGARAVDQAAARTEVSPPNCPFLRPQMIRADAPQDCHAETTECGLTTQAEPRWSQRRKLQMVDAAAYRRQGEASHSGWSALCNQAKQVLSKIVTTSADVIHRANTNQKPFASIFEGFSPLRAKEDDPKVVAIRHGSDICDETIDRDDVPQRPSNLLPSQPSLRFVKVDGLLKPLAPRPALQQVAASRVKTIVKKNASLLLVTAIPSSLSSDIGSLLRRSNQTRFVFEARQGPSHDGLRVSPLPSEVVSHDEFRVENAGASVGLLAQRMTKAISPPPLSLTNLSLALPSLWRERGVLAYVGAPSVNVRSILHKYHEDQGIRSHVEEGEDDTCVDQRVATSPVHEACVVHVSEPNQGSETKSAPIATPAIQCTMSLALTTTPPAAPAAKKTVAFKIQESVSTDELVMTFLREDCEDPLVRGPSSSSANAVKSSDASGSDPKFALTIDQLARPAVWFLVRVKLLRVKSVAMIDALKAIPLEVLATIVLQLQSKLKSMVSHSATTPHDEIIETCFAFRHAVWLHSLRMLVEYDGSSKSSSRLIVASRLVASATYQSAFGKKQSNAMRNLYISMGGSPLVLPPAEPVGEGVPTSVEEPPQKKPRASLAQQESTPVRLICAMHLLERDELLEELSDLGVSVIERELPPAIDIVVDEHNAIVLLTDQHFAEEKLMKVLTYELATAQIQFRKLWLILDVSENELALHFFFAALTNFKIDVQTFSCHGDADISHAIRGIVDACADAALSQHRVLPRMWFARPFMLEEESQIERFLSSTRIMNAFAAQSVLHRLSFDELISKSMEELKIMIGASLTSDQLPLLWKLLHNRHGIGNGESTSS